MQSSRSVTDHLQKVQNFKSFRRREITMKDLIIDLLFSSEIYLDEEQVLFVVNQYLSEIKPANQIKMSKRQIIQMSFKGYMGILNELFGVRHVFIRHFREKLGIFFNVLGSLFTVW